MTDLPSVCFRCAGPSDAPPRRLCLACAAELEAEHRASGLPPVEDVLLDLALSRLGRERGVA